MISEVFLRHRIHFIFDNEAEIMIYKFWKYRLSVHAWPIYWDQLQKSHISWSLNTNICGSFCCSKNVEKHCCREFM